MTEPLTHLQKELLLEFVMNVHIVESSTSK